MKPVAIVGAGQTNYGDFPDKGVKELFADAYRDMIASVDKGVDPGEIKAAYIGSLSAGSGFQLGQLPALLAGHVGLPNLATCRVESACATGSMALLWAVMAVGSGKHDLVMASGVEKMKDVSSNRGKYWLGVSGDTEYERLAGSTFAGIYAIMAQRFMYEYSLERKYLSQVAVKNHKHGAQNPKAQFRTEIDLETALNGIPVAYPFNIWDCSSTTDGAAAVLVTTVERAKEFTDRPVLIVGTGSGGDYLALQDRDTLTSIKATRQAAQEAYREAGIGPDDIDFAEVHDCFTIAEILAYGDLGFCEKGKEFRLLEEGITSLGGKKPINASGGLKAKGHPIGATGIGMASEIFHQMRDEVQNPSRQIRNAEFALSHNVGGSGGTANVIIYKRG